MNVASPLLTVDNLAHAYRGDPAVQSLSFSLEAGQVLAVVGQNGAGKTTTLKCIAGLIHPDQGSVTIDGESAPWTNASARQLCGFCPENPSLYTAYTVAEQLQLACDLRRLSGRQSADAIERVLQLCDLSGQEHRVLAELSKGFRQRVSLAQALIGSPRLVILDEPASGLDPIHIAELRVLIRDLVPEMSVILSTHSLCDASVVADSLLVMNQGRSCYQGGVKPPEREALHSLHLEQNLTEAQMTVLEKMCVIRSVNDRVIELSLESGTRPADLIDSLVSSGVRIESLQPRNRLTEDDMLDLIMSSQPAGELA